MARSDDDSSHSDGEYVDGNQLGTKSRGNKNIKVIRRRSRGIGVTEFNGRNNFALWKGEVTDALVNDDLIEALEEEPPNDMTEREWRLLNKKACGNIRDYLCPDIKYIFQRETNAFVLWNKLEEKYAKKTM